MSIKLFNKLIEFMESQTFLNILFAFHQFVCVHIVTCQGSGVSSKSHLPEPTDERPHQGWHISIGWYMPISTKQIYRYQLPKACWYVLGGKIRAGICTGCVVPHPGTKCMGFYSVVRKRRRMAILPATHAQSAVYFFKIWCIPRLPA